MDLTEAKIKTKCDNGACRNMAAYTVNRTDTPLDMRLNICKECAADLFTLLKSRINTGETGKEKK